MSLTQQKKREIVFQILFAKAQNRNKQKELVRMVQEQLHLDRTSVVEAQKRVSLVEEKLSEIDRLIEDNSHAYAMHRIQPVEKNILRLCVFEMLFDPAIPQKVAIAEALRLAKKFATEEGGSFILAILNGILENHGQNLPH